MEYFSLCAATIFVTASSVVLWYYFKYMVPYWPFPWYRYDIRLPLWILQGKNLKSFLIEKSLEVCEQYSEEGVLVVWGIKPYVLVFGEEEVRAVMNDPAAIDKPPLYNVMKDVVGDSLIISNGEKYKKQKKWIHPAFHLVSLKGKVSTMNKNAVALTDRIRELHNVTTDQTFDLLKECLLRIFAESSLGIDEVNNAELYKKISRILEIIPKVRESIMYKAFLPWLRMDFVSKLFPSVRRHQRLQEEGKEMSLKALQQMKNNLCIRKSAEKTKDEDGSENFGQTSKLFSEILLEEHIRDPSITLEDVLGQFTLLLVAGYDTAATTLLWCLFLLGHHPDVQERVYQEAISITNGDVHYEDLKNLEYLDCVIKETMRLYPVSPFLGRYVRKDLKCGKYTIPKNSTIGVFVYLLHRNPKIYPDPEKFDPDRFNTKNSRIRLWNHIPFAEGARSCPGKVFALMEMKIILTHIVRDFRLVSIDRREDVGVSWDTLMVPDKTIRMKFISRQMVS